MAKVLLPVNFDINLHLQAELHLYLFQGAYQSNQGNIKTLARLISLFSELLCKNWSCLLNDDKISSNLHFLKIIIMAF